MPVTIIQLEVSNTYLKKKRYVPAKTSHFSVVAKKQIFEFLPNLEQRLREPQNSACSCSAIRAPPNSDIVCVIPCTVEILREEIPNVLLELCQEEFSRGLWSL